MKKKKNFPRLKLHTKKQPILCPPDVIILMIKHIKSVDPHGDADLRMSDERPVICQERIVKATKGFPQSMKPTPGPSICGEVSAPGKKKKKRKRNKRVGLSRLTEAARASLKQPASFL